MSRRFRLLLMLVLGLGMAVEAAAQTATVRGFVTEQATGEPLEGVNVVLRGADDALFGVSTDADGFFARSRLPQGAYVVRASFIGYEAYEDTLALAAGDVRTLTIALAVDPAQLDELVVESEREASGAGRLTGGKQTIRPRDIQLIPAPDVSGDLVNYLTTLPGVVSQGDRGGQLFIRGGEPTQNLVLLDGIPIYQPFHVIGFFSALPADIINLADVYAGGFGGRFGGRLSSVIDITSRNGNKEEIGAAVSLAPFVSAVRVEGPLVTGKVSMLASVRESVLDIGASHLVAQPLPYRFGDRFGKIHARLGQNSQLSVTGLSTYDRGLVGQDIEGKVFDLDRQQEIVWQNEAAGARYLHLPPNIPILAEFLLTVTHLRSDFGPVGAPDRFVAATQYDASAHVTHFLGPTDITWGLFQSTYKLDNQLGGQFQNITFDREFVVEVGVYLQAEVRLRNGLRAVGGARVQHFPSKNNTFLEPRLQMVWQRGRHRWSLAGGFYHQEILGLNDRRDAGNVFTAWTAAPFKQVPEAWHGIAGWQVSLTPWLDVAAEGYFKHLSNLSVSEWTALPRFTTNVQQADGQVQGLDVRLEVNRPGFYALASYGLARVVYDARQRSIPLWFGSDDGFRYPPPHDRRHQVSAVVGVERWGFGLNAQWQYGSGLPYNQVLGFDDFLFMDHVPDYFEEPTTPRVIYDQPYRGRLPSYHRLDVSVSREVPVYADAVATFQAGVINLYDRDNLFYLDLFTLGRVNQLPLLPTFGVKVEVH